MARSRDDNMWGIMGGGSSARGGRARQPNPLEIPNVGFAAAGQQTPNGPRGLADLAAPDGTAGKYFGVLSPIAYRGLPQGLQNPNEVFPPSPPPRKAFLPDPAQLQRPPSAPHDLPSVQSRLAPVGPSSLATVEERLAACEAAVQNPEVLARVAALERRAGGLERGTAGSREEGRMALQRAEELESRLASVTAALSVAESSMAEMRRRMEMDAGDARAYYARMDGLIDSKISALMGELRTKEDQAVKQRGADRVREQQLAAQVGILAGMVDALRQEGDATRPVLAAVAQRLEVTAASGERTREQVLEAERRAADQLAALQAKARAETMELEQRLQGLREALNRESDRAVEYARSTAEVLTRFQGDMSELESRLYKKAVAMLEGHAHSVLQRVRETEQAVEEREMTAAKVVGEGIRDFAVRDAADKRGAAELIAALQRALEEEHAARLEQQAALRRDLDAGLAEVAGVLTEEKRTREAREVKLREQVNEALAKTKVSITGLETMHGDRVAALEQVVKMEINARIASMNKLRQELVADGQQTRIHFKASDAEHKEVAAVLERRTKLLMAAQQQLYARQGQVEASVSSGMRDLLVLKRAVQDAADGLVVDQLLDKELLSLEVEAYGPGLKERVDELEAKVQAASTALEEAVSREGHARETILPRVRQDLEALAEALANSHGELAQALEKESAAREEDASQMSQGFQEAMYNVSMETDVALQRERNVTSGELARITSQLEHLSQFVGHHPERYTLDSERLRKLSRTVAEEDPLPVPAAGSRGGQNGAVEEGAEAAPGDAADAEWATERTDTQKGSSGKAAVGQLALGRNHHARLAAVEVRMQDMARELQEATTTLQQRSQTLEEQLASATEQLQAQTAAMDSRLEEASAALVARDEELQNVCDELALQLGEETTAREEAGDKLRDDMGVLASTLQAAMQGMAVLEQRKREEAVAQLNAALKELGERAEEGLERLEGQLVSEIQALTSALQKDLGELRQNAADALAAEGEDRELVVQALEDAVRESFGAITGQMDDLRVEQATQGETVEWLVELVGELRTDTDGCLDGQKWLEEAQKRLEGEQARLDEEQKKLEETLRASLLDAFLAKVREAVEAPLRGELGDVRQSLEAECEMRAESVAKVAGDVSQQMEGLQQALQSGLEQEAIARDAGLDKLGQLVAEELEPLRTGLGEQQASMHALTETSQHQQAEVLDRLEQTEADVALGLDVMRADIVAVKEGAAAELEEARRADRGDVDHLEDVLASVIRELRDKVTTLERTALVGSRLGSRSADKDNAKDTTSPAASALTARVDNLALLLANTTQELDKLKARDTQGNASSLEAVHKELNTRIAFLTARVEEVAAASSGGAVARRASGKEALAGAAAGVGATTGTAAGGGGADASNKLGEKLTALEEQVGLLLNILQ
eukprot:jgi/Mesvir1/20777/Mv07891-RA.3